MNSFATLTQFFYILIPIILPFFTEAKNAITKTSQHPHRFQKWTHTVLLDFGKTCRVGSLAGWVAVKLLIVLVV